MKVALLTTSVDDFKEGGWVRYSFELASMLNEKGISVQTFVESRSLGQKPTPLPACVGLKSAATTRFFNTLSIIHDYFWLIEKTKNVDIVHALVEHHAFVAWLLRKPFFITAHGTYLPRFLKHPWFGWWMRRVLQSKRCHVVCGSEFTRNEILKLVHVQNIWFLPNGVDLKKFTKSPNSGQRPVFITAGAVKSRKGQDLAVEAFSSICEQFPEASYLIVGDQSGPFAKRLRDYVHEKHLEARIIFQEGVDDAKLISIYSSSLAFLLPSRLDKGGAFEGFPLSLLEAAACELPLVGSYGCGSEHLIENGTNGFLIDPDDVNALAKHMVFFLTQKVAARQMGLKAREAAEHFSWDHHAATLLKLYTTSTVRHTSNDSI